MQANCKAARRSLFWASSKQANGFQFFRFQCQKSKKGKIVLSKILIIEDDENIVGFEKDYIEASEMHADGATDGNTGLELALNNEYDLILLDVMLPGINGFEICKKIRKTKNTPIIFVTAKRDEIDKISGLGYGADDYIVKPFSPA